MILIVYNRYPFSEEFKGQINFDRLDQVFAVSATDEHLKQVKEQFANIPYNTQYHDHYTWHGDLAKDIIVNFRWSEDEKSK
jgi:hypothetical protein